MVSTRKQRQYPSIYEDQNAVLNNAMNKYFHLKKTPASYLRTALFVNISWFMVLKLVYYSNFYYFFLHFEFTSCTETYGRNGN
jgi:hypothetical protein